MPLITTPGTYLGLSEFYYQISTMLRAGLGMMAALETLELAPPSRTIGLHITPVLASMRSGLSLSESVRNIPGWLPSFDISLIEAAEKSGREEEVFRMLSEYYRQQASLYRMAVSGLIYPIVLIHMAILIFPTTLLSRLIWQSEVYEFVTQKLSILAPLYAIVLAILFASQSNRGLGIRAVIERIFRFIPLLGSARTNLAFARFSAALESLLSAGVSVPDAWRMAGESSGSPRLQKVIDTFPPRIMAGVAPSELLPRYPIFPRLFTTLYCTGEKSGDIDGSLKRMYRHYEEQASNKFKAFAEWVPRVVVFCVVVTVGYFIVSFYVGYFGAMGEAIDAAGK